MARYAEKLEAHFCEDGHLHIILSSGRGKLLAEIALSLEDGLDLVDDLIGQIKELGVLDDDDEIGPVAGNA